MKIIHFFADVNRHNLGQPVPIKRLIPEWYRKAEREFTRGNEKALTFKACIPFLDVMTSGYAFVTPFDIHVSKNEEGMLNITWDGPEPFKDYVVQRDALQTETIPVPAGHLPNHMAFVNPWGFKTPRGWSVLVTPPFNRFDLPFTVTSGIIDSDKYGTGGNLPFYLRADFEGTIPAGTPIAQLTPIKRANWHHVPNNIGKRFLNNLQGSLVRSKGHSYKRDFWQRKKFD